MNQKPKTCILYSRPQDNRVSAWRDKISTWLTEKGIALSEQHPDAIIVLGGDGTLIEAARAHASIYSPIILGLNLGTLGFLTAESDSHYFFTQLEKFLRGEYFVSERMTLSVIVQRNEKEIFSAIALNEIVIQSLLGIVELEVAIGGYTVERIRGSGVLLVTPTGSTAYNLSAHGPIVSPDLDCIIVTELLDHSIPTPSVVVGGKESIEVCIRNFRERKLISLSTTGESVNVMMITDGDLSFPLQIGDRLMVARGPHKVRLVEFESNHFFKSLHAKFPFK